MKIHSIKLAFKPVGSCGVLNQPWICWVCVVFCFFFCIDAAFKAGYRRLWLDNVHFLPPRQASSQMFLATKKTQLHIVLQRQRSYKCSYLCLSPDCKMSQILGWKNPEILSLSQKKKLLKRPHSFWDKCKIYSPNISGQRPASPIPCRVSWQSCTIRH